MHTVLGAVRNRKEVENRSSYNEKLTVRWRRKCIYTFGVVIESKVTDWPSSINCQEGLQGFREARAHYDLEGVEKMGWKTRV